MIEHDLNRISILDTLGESEQKITLMHEICHGITSQRDIVVGTENSSNEETIVSEFGKCFIQIIRDNPDLIDYLKDEYIEVTLEGGEVDGC